MPQIQAGLRTQTLIERLIFALVIFSILVSFFLLNWGKEHDIGSGSLFRILSFYPEQVIFGDVQSPFLCVVASSNICNSLFLFLAALFHPRTEISDKYYRQDRKNALMLLALCFLLMRVCMIWAFTTERGPIPTNGHFPTGSNPMAVLGFPAVNLISVGCALLSITTKPYDGGEHGS